MHTSLLRQLCDLGEQCDNMAAALLRSSDKSGEAHRLYMACKEFSITLGRALTALTDKSRDQIESVN